jgi:ribosomal protein S17E
MIKKFEQFVLECYNNQDVNPVNEAFQSSKLRNIIKQHGKPKYSWDNKMLYDLKDDEIIDVVDSREKYWENYDKYQDKQKTFIIELEDGSCIVIGNFGIFKKWYEESNDQKRLDDIFKRRHAERHKGNLGKRGGDDINKKHIKNVIKIESKRLTEQMKGHIPEIVNKVKSVMDDINASEILDNEISSSDIESEFTINGEEYGINVYYTADISDTWKSCGVESCYVNYRLDYFEIYTEDNACCTNDDINVTEKTHSDLFEEYEKELECGVYDYYECYGLSRGDFF